MKIYNLNRNSVQKVLKDWTTDRAFDYQALINFNYDKLDKAVLYLFEQLQKDIEAKALSDNILDYIQTISISISILNDDNNLLLASPDIYQYKAENFNNKYIIEVLTSLLTPILEKLYTTEDIFPTHYFSDDYTMKQEQIQNNKVYNLYNIAKLVIKAIKEMLVMLRRFNNLNNKDE